MKATIYIGKWTENSVTETTRWWIDEDNNIVIIDRSRNVLQIALDDVIKFKENGTSVNVKRLDSSYFDIKIEKIKDYFGIKNELSFCNVRENQVIIQVKDTDVYEVSRPEGENVLKIRRFRATVGSLTLEGEYSILLNGKASASRQFSVYPYRTRVLIVLDEMVRVYALYDNNACLVVERNISYQYIQPLYCGKIGVVKESPDKSIEYTIISTGYIDTDTDDKDRIDIRIDNGNNKDMDMDSVERIKVYSCDAYQWEIICVSRDDNDDVRYLTGITKYNEQEISQWSLDNVPFDYRMNESARHERISFFINAEELLIYYTMNLDPPMKDNNNSTEDDSIPQSLHALTLSRVSIDLHTGQRADEAIDMTEHYKGSLHMHRGMRISIIPYDYSVIIGIEDKISKTSHHHLLILRRDDEGIIMVKDIHREYCDYNAVDTVYRYDRGYVWKKNRYRDVMDTIGNNDITCRDINSGIEFIFDNPLVGEKEIQGQKKEESNSSLIRYCATVANGMMYCIRDSLNRCVIYSIASNRPTPTLYDKLPSDDKQIVLSPDGLFLTLVTPSRAHDGIYTYLSSIYPLERYPHLIYQDTYPQSSSMKRRETMEAFLCTSLSAYP